MNIFSKASLAIAGCMVFAAGTLPAQAGGARARGEAPRALGHQVAQPSEQLTSVTLIPAGHLRRADLEGVRVSYAEGDTLKSVASLGNGRFLVSAKDGGVTLQVGSSKVYLDTGIVPSGREAYIFYDGTNASLAFLDPATVTAELLDPKPSTESARGGREEADRSSCSSALYIDMDDSVTETFDGAGYVTPSQGYSCSGVYQAYKNNFYYFTGTGGYVTVTVEPECSLGSSGCFGSQLTILCGTCADGFSCSGYATATYYTTSSGISTLTVPTVADTDYYIWAGNYYQASSYYAGKTLTVTVENSGDYPSSVTPICPPPPANDTCDGALDLTGLENTLVPVTNAGANNDCPIASRSYDSSGVDPDYGCYGLYGGPDSGYTYFIYGDCYGSGTYTATTGSVYYKFTGTGRTHVISNCNTTYGAEWSDGYPYYGGGLYTYMDAYCGGCDDLSCGPLRNHLFPYYYYGDCRGDYENLSSSDPNWSPYHGTLKIQTVAGQEYIVKLSSYYYYAPFFGTLWYGVEGPETSCDFCGAQPDVCGHECSPCSLDVNGNGFAFSNDEGCCNRVCLTDPSCCTGEWNQKCALEALSCLGCPLEFGSDSGFSLPFGIPSP